MWAICFRIPSLPGVSQPLVCGYDGAGVVEAVGSEATLFKVGDRVYTAGVINRNGTNAGGDRAGCVCATWCCRRAFLCVLAKALVGAGECGLAVIVQTSWLWTSALLATRPSR
jgi:hypothetical protein